MSESVPFSEARRRFSSLLERVRTRHEHVIITRNGEPEALLISPEEYETLIETLDVLADTETMDALRESERDVERGDLTPLDEARRRLLSE